MEVKLLAGFSKFEYEGKQFRKTLFTLDDDRQVEFICLEGKDVPQEGDILNDEWEVIEKTDKKGNKTLRLQKKKTDNGWSGKKYEKKEVNPRAYLINTCLPSVLPEIMSKKLCIESFFKVMEQCLDWVDGNYKFSELSADQFKALHAVIAEHGYKHEDLHKIFAVESSKEITLESYTSFMRQVQNMPKDEVKKFLKGLLNA